LKVDLASFYDQSSRKVKLSVSKWSCFFCLIGTAKPLSHRRTQIWTVWSENLPLLSDWTSQASVYRKGRVCTVRQEKSSLCMIEGSSLHCLIGWVTFAICLDESCLIYLIEGVKLLLSDQDSCVWCLIGWGKPFLFNYKSHLCCLIEEIKSLLFDRRSLNALALSS